jgi:HD-GYP domain-containing protein (c-di-GMP phosphodiesterase class II)
VTRAPRSPDAQGDAPRLLLSLLRRRRPDVAAHSGRVRSYARFLAWELAFGSARSADFEVAAILHDIGKLAVPGRVLSKPGPLDKWEWEQVRRHPELGADLVRNHGLDRVAPWIEAHHERPDGSGYPRGLCGDEIPVEARAIAIIDAYHAMTSDRPYRRALSRTEAVEEIRTCAGSQFDSDLARTFVVLISTNGSG